MCSLCDTSGGKGLPESTRRLAALNIEEPVKVLSFGSDGALDVRAVEERLGIIPTPLPVELVVVIVSIDILIGHGCSPSTVQKRDNE